MLARSLSSVLDVDALLTQIVEAAVSLTNAEEGLLLLPDEEEQALYIRAHKGIDSETASTLHQDNTLAGQVLHSGEPILVGDQGWQKIKTEYLVQSLLYVPLISKGKTIGVLGVNNIKTDRPFTEHDSDLLQDLAAHAAVAIENARLFAESEQRAAEIRMLVEAGEAANSTLAIDRVLSAIAHQLLSALDVSQCYTAEQNPETGTYSLLAVTARAVWRPGEGPIRLDQRELGVTEAFRHQKIAVITPDELASPEEVADWLPYRYAAQQIVYLPLIANGKRIGLITLYHISNPYFADAYTEEVQGQIQQIALDGVLQVLASKKDVLPQRILFRGAEKILKLVRANWCEISLWNQTEQGFQVLLSYGEGIWPEEPRPSIDTADYPRLFDRLSAAPFTESDYGESSADRRAMSQRARRAADRQDRTSGFVMLVDTLRTRSFTAADDLAQALVLQPQTRSKSAPVPRVERSLTSCTARRASWCRRWLTAMGELAAAVAHQISNPLTTILVDSELLLRALPDDAADRESIEAIYRCGQRAHEVVRRLLTMARQQTSDDNLTAVDVNETIHNTLMLVKGHIQQGGVQVRLSLENNLPPVVAPSGQLEDVWLNLLMNARDAVSNCPTREIGIASRGLPAHDAVEVTVWDTGVGIPEHLMNEIFEPFFTSKPPGEGTGLGLHICRQIVEKCGGMLHVESVEREGTRFIIRLPLYHRQD